MHPQRTRPCGLRRGAQAAAVLAVVIGVRQLVDLVLGATAPTWSTDATMLVETLVLTGLYGALAWFFVVVPIRRRSVPQVSVDGGHLRPALVRHQNGPVLRAVPATRPRHLTLVPGPNHR